MSPELTDLERRINAAKARHGIGEAEIMAAIRAQRVAALCSALWAASNNLNAAAREFERSIARAGGAIREFARIAGGAIREFARIAGGALREGPGR